MDGVSARVPKEIDQLPEVERDSALKKLALDYIKEHPGRFLYLAWLKFSRFWNVVPNYNEYQSNKYILVSIFSFGPVLLLALWALIRLRYQWIIWLILIAPIIYFTLIHMVFSSGIRYRAPVEPYLIILAATSISFLFSKLFPPKVKPLS
jgi:hypothetical protein